MSLLDIFFPKYCVGCKVFGSYLCTNCFTEVSFDTHVICLVCGKGSLDGRTHPMCRKKYSIDGVVCAVAYRKIIKKLIYVFKYQPYVSDVQHVLLDLFYESLIQKELFLRILSDNSVFIPVPLSAQKFRKRGYTQSFLLAKGLAKKLHIPISDSLLRVKHTQPQFGLSKNERKENMQDAFAFKGGELIEHSIAIIIDDVLTTGATLSEAANVLKNHGFQYVWGVTFARD